MNGGNDGVRPTTVSKEDLELTILIKVCITEISMNGNKIQAGKFRDRHAFWIAGDRTECEDNGFIISQEITIQNEVITQSACHQ